MSFGNFACRRFQPRPSRSAESARKFSTSTSASFNRSKSVPLPSSVCRSTVRLTLPRLALRKYALSPLSPSSKGGPQPRLGSPSGGSSFCTSAPKSASNWVAKGPASTQDRSTILKWDRGLGIAIGISKVQPTSPTWRGESAGGDRPTVGGTQGGGDLLG